MTRKRTVAVTLATCLAVQMAWAQDFPSQPITIVNPYSAGGPADLISRTVAESMSKALGQPVVVENRPGAATAIAAMHVAQAEPDGYTLLIAGSPTHVITPELQPDADYDGVADFAPVALVATVPNVLVVPTSLGVTTAQELADLAASEADALAFASVGNGSLPHLSSVLFMQETGSQMVHIPYGGAAPAVVDLLAGNVDMGFLNAPPLMSHIENGDLVALGIASDERSEQLPDTQTMEELGFGNFQMSTWYGLSAPAGTSEDVIATLDEAVKTALDDADVREKLSSQGVMVTYRPSADFAAFLATDAERMLGLLDAAGVEGQ